MTTKLVSKNFDVKDSHKLEVAKKNGVYKSIDKLFKMKPEDVVQEVCDSGLRGKGGGGAYCGDKWKLLPDDGREVYLIVNADESEPGTFKDRHIMHYDPHLLIEGIICACYAIKSHSAYIYIRGEFVKEANILQEAIDEAYKAGILGKSVCGHDYAMDVVVHRGAGAYICGEKSALIESLEGKRGNPRLKPHQKECEWYFDMPAIVNNVETIASVPYIINEGAKGYRAFGTKDSPGTAIFGASGEVEKPGIFELAYGESMIEVLDKLCGGMKDGKKLKAVIPGGASCPILTADEVKKAKLDYESMWDIGSTLGTGGMIVISEDTSMVEVAKNLIEFYHHESCGQCTPCREGVGWIDKILQSVIDNEATKEDIDTISDVCNTMNGKTICVFAPAVSAIIASIIKKFPEEFDAYLNKNKKKSVRV